MVSRYSFLFPSDQHTIDTHWAIRPQIDQNDPETRHSQPTIDRNSTFRQTTRSMAQQSRKRSIDFIDLEEDQPTKKARTQPIDLSNAVWIQWCADVAFHDPKNAYVNINEIPSPNPEPVNYEPVNHEPVNPPPVEEEEKEEQEEPFNLDQLLVDTPPQYNFEAYDSTPPTNIPKNNNWHEVFQHYRMEEIDRALGRGPTRRRRFFGNHYCFTPIPHRTNHANIPNISEDLANHAAMFMLTRLVPSEGDYIIIKDLKKDFDDFTDKAYNIGYNRLWNVLQPCAEKIGIEFEKGRISKGNSVLCHYRLVD